MFTQKNNKIRIIKNKMIKILKKIIKKSYFIFSKF